jgi:ABC-2 type transport system permease protein
VTPASPFWLARHEFRLGWRDIVHVLTAGRRSRLRTAAAVLVVFVVAMHLIARAMMAPYAALLGAADKATLVAVTGTLALWGSLLLSQAMESVTRVFYARSDLDLLMSAPVAPRRLFSVRIAQIAVSVTAMAMLLASPFIDVLAYEGGARWLMAYGVVAALGMMATAVAVALTALLFRALGAKRTRLIAQIVAAVIGAGFVIGLQTAAILTYGKLSRFAPLQSHWLIAHAPPPDSVLYCPARAALGDAGALVAVLVVGFALLVAIIAAFAGRFGGYALAAAGVSHAVVRQRGRRAFRGGSAQAMLRRKEWVLLRRDPWLMSQTLMQILYLLPPALLLWRDFHQGVDGFVVIVPVLTMAAGQLGGGLAWLSISGEDAPDLVATGPLTARQVLRAKIEAVMGAVALVFAPFVAAIALPSPRAALVAASGVVIAAGAATAIQLCFRTQAKRSQFRRRQVSSRLATFAEAFSSIAWAAAAGMALVGTPVALAPALVAVAILIGVRTLSAAGRAGPSRGGAFSPFYGARVARTRRVRAG